MRHSPEKQLYAITLLIQESVQNGLTDDIEHLLVQRQELVDAVCVSNSNGRDDDSLRRTIAVEAEIITVLQDVRSQVSTMIQGIGKTKNALDSYRRSA